MNNREKLEQWVDQNPGAWKSTPVKDIMEKADVPKTAVYTYLPRIIAEREGIKPSEVLPKRREAKALRHNKIDVDRLIVLYGEGTSVQDIAIQLGCHKNSVYYHIGEYNKLTDPQRIEKWVERNPEGWEFTTTGDIMAAAVVSEEAVNDHLPRIIAEREGIEPSVVVTKRRVAKSAQLNRIDVETLRNLHRSGIGRHAMARELNCSVEMVRYYLRKHIYDETETD